MARPSTYHENMGCHNCKYYEHSAPYGLCLFEEKTINFLFGGYEDDLDGEAWDRMIKEKKEFRERCNVASFGHCAEWKKTDL